MLSNIISLDPTRECDPRGRLERYHERIRIVDVDVFGCRGGNGRKSPIVLSLLLSRCHRLCGRCVSREGSFVLPFTSSLFSLRTADPMHDSRLVRRSFREVTSLPFPGVWLEHCASLFFFYFAGKPHTSCVWVSLLAMALIGVL